MLNSWFVAGIISGGQSWTDTAGDMEAEIGDMNVNTGDTDAGIDDTNVNVGDTLRVSVTQDASTGDRKCMGSSHGRTSLSSIASPSVRCFFFKCSLHVSHITGLS